MLNLLGPRHAYCDGVTRRNFLRIGSLALGGLTLPQLLQAEQNRPGKRQRSVIMVYLTGGLAHQDTFDLKPNAPAEVRGEFKPIATNVPGIQICEHLPQLAALHGQDGAASAPLTGFIDEHSSFQNMTGFPHGRRPSATGKPHFGSVIAKVQGPADPVIPPFVDLFAGHAAQALQQPGPGFLGRAPRVRSHGRRRSRRHAAQIAERSAN